MIQIYDVNDLTGNLDEIFQSVMKVGFTISISLLAFWSLMSLLIWFFRCKEKI